MNLQFVAPTEMSHADLSVCKDYFLIPVANFNSSLTHAAFICDKHIISIEQLTYYINQVEVFNTDIHCQACHAAYRVYEPTHIIYMPKTWLCTACLLQLSIRAI